jgi:hypothetical protein
LAQSNGHFRRIDKRDSVYLRRVAGNHHAAGNHDCEDCADQGIEARPLEIRESEPLVGYAALLEEQLPRRNRGPNDRNYEKYVIRRDAPWGTDGTSELRTISDADGRKKKAMAIHAISSRQSTTTMRSHRR